MNHKWLFATAQAAQINTSFEKMLRPLTKARLACALVHNDETPLLVKPQSHADAMTLTTAAATCRRYLKLKNRDVALLNDPSSGGTLLTQITLVAGLAPRGGDAELLFVMRFNVNPPSQGLKGVLSEEGVQVPPMPIAQNGVINFEILKAIGQHPQAAPDFAERVEFEIKRLLACLDGAKPIFMQNTRDWTERVKLYVQQSSRAFENAMARVPLGGMNVMATLPSRELMKLHLEVNEKHILFDFKGSDGSQNLGLSEHVTFSACVAAILKWTASKLPLGEGVISHFQLSAPSKSLLSAKAPLGAWRGTNEALPILMNLIQSALAKLAKTPIPETKKTATSDLCLELKSNSNLTLTPARLITTDLSIERLEQTWPFSVSQVSRQTNA